MATAPDRLAGMPHVEIRAMTDNDVRAVVEIERTSYQFPWSEGIFRDCLRVGYVCRVVLSGEELIGYGIMSTGAGEAHILNLCVRDSYRCRGIGRTLLEHLLSRAGAGGSSEAYLEVRPSNTAAIRLYQTLGFEPIGVRRGYYQAVGGREDAAVLRLPLRSRRAHES
ncbi:MAG TPA: ribosomal protein S18-alanine N-acetyltransferase [Steroidobacteraceae bacterium]|nr:ribosomal protein S18-alanine N-acetyltransferase [Steroidobacteraceae bacterium]